MMGDKPLPKHSPDKNQMLVVINGIYHVRNSLNKLEPSQQSNYLLFTA